MRRLLAIVAAVALGAAACGGDDGATDQVVGDGSGQTTTTVPAAGDDDGSDDGDAAGDADVAVADTTLGPVLVDAEGMTLYLFTNDSEGSSACTGGCADTWPPLVVDAEPVPGDGVDAALLGTITRDDGGTQVTYAGHPLYRYAADQAAGDVTGHEVGGVWFAVTADGEPAGDSGGGDLGY